MESDLLKIEDPRYPDLEHAVMAAYYDFSYLGKNKKSSVARSSRKYGIPKYIIERQFFKLKWLLACGRERQRES